MVASSQPLTTTEIKMAANGFSSAFSRLCVWFSVRVTFPKRTGFRNPFIPPLSFCLLPPICLFSTTQIDFKVEKWGLLLQLETTKSSSLCLRLSARHTSSSLCCQMNLRLLFLLAWQDSSCLASLAFLDNLQRRLFPFHINMRLFCCAWYFAFFNKI